jgi:hypothetical protein
MIRHHPLSRSRILLISTALLCSACSKEEVAPVSGPAAPRIEPVVVHATMPASRIMSVLDAYTAETGKEIQLASDDMDASTADLFLAPNIAELWQFAETDLFRPTVSESIERNIPSALRDPEFRWTALATHARIVVHNTALVSIDELGDVDNYAALGQEKWRNRICLSSSAVPGNRTLIALLIRRYDLREAEIIVRNWRANFATGVFADDLSLIKAISCRCPGCRSSLQGSRCDGCRCERRRRNKTCEKSAGCGRSFGMVDDERPERLVCGIGPGISSQCRCPG